MLVGPMAAVDQVRALTEAGVVGRASQLAAPGTRLLPVLSPFEALLPDPGLRRGSIIRITGAGATSLALALVARASRDAWVAVVGMPSLGLVWASELGIALDRLVVVPEPGAQWLSVLAAAVDAFDVVVARPPGSRERDARKLSARVREQRSLLLVTGEWPEAETRLAGSASRWHGVGRGHGHLTARTLTITVSGRGVASRPREATLWLPDEDGRIALAGEANVVPIKRTG